MPWHSSSHAAFLRRSPPLFSTSADEDWRAFRARLILMVNDTSTTSTFMDRHKHTFMPPPTRSASWAYDAGLLVEKGSIVLSRIEPNLACPNLDQPYFGKCVVLIVEHDDEEQITQGIILNRPSDLKMDSQGNVIFGSDSNHADRSSSGGDYSTMIRLEEFDEEYAKARKREEWRMFFGGEIATLEVDDDDEVQEETPIDDFDDNDRDDSDEEVMIVCLHNITSPRAQELSDQILPGVYMTSHASARSLVASGEATPESFYLFYGFCGWDPYQLQTEVQNGSWYLASISPRTLWNELAVLRDDAYDTQLAGLDMWENLIHKIGKSSEVAQDIAGCADSNDFSDLMLMEWVTQTLTATPHRGSVNAGIDDALIYRALHAADRPPVQAGSLLRGSSLPESPYLFDDQFLHKSTVLVLHEDDEASIGMILNLPTSEILSVPINNSTTANFTIRYGGPSNDERMEDNNDDYNDGDQQESMIFLHCSAGLKFFGTGKPLVFGDENGVWTCTKDQAAKAIDLGFGVADEFMVVKGFCQWEKEAGAGGVLGQVMSGNLEVVASDKIDGAWTTLRRQTQLSNDSLRENLKLANDAWLQASDDETTLTEEKPRVVFGSTVLVDELADRAFSTWVELHLLQEEEVEDNDTEDSSSTHEGEI